MKEGKEVWIPSQRETQGDATGGRSGIGINFCMFIGCREGTEKGRDGNYISQINS